jgi:hypothetical protein
MNSPDRRSESYRVRRAPQGTRRAIHVALAATLVAWGSLTCATPFTRLAQAEPRSESLASSALHAAQPSKIADGLTMTEAMTTAYGTFDPVAGGSYWKPEGLADDLEGFNGQLVLAKPQSTRRFVRGDRERVLLVTNTLYIEDGRIVSPGDGCHACPVLVGLFLFERKAGGPWRVEAGDRSATSAGSWGRMPRATITGSFDAPALKIEDGYMAQGQISEWTVLVRYAEGRFHRRMVSLRRSCFGGPPCAATSDARSGTPPRKSGQP